MPHSLAIDAARLAGDRHAQSRGRVFWTDADWKVARSEYQRLTGIDLIDAMMARTSSHIASEFLRQALS